MLIVMKQGASERQLEEVMRVVKELGFQAHTMAGISRTAIGITGNQSPIDPSRFETLPGIAEVIRVSKPYKLVTLDFQPQKTVVRVGDATIGGDDLAIIAGPCAVESRAQALAIAQTVQ